MQDLENVSLQTLQLMWIASTKYERDQIVNFVIISLCFGVTGILLLQSGVT